VEIAGISNEERVYGIEGEDSSEEDDDDIFRIYEVLFAAELVSSLGEKEEGMGVSTTDGREVSVPRCGVEWTCGSDGE
jgi:hypothetical protein